ncbi:hypothetical protein TEA_024183 [Camellia sinensis var. sinensis]|uniref:Transglutaminase-like domain-containing protein n=1 Tax=Camellia sinensis var. sinensis TaxID=542762 RepID=A0A4S4D384_CAMSN|nr:hypothetical protein TEA_024183 [Camellia sinensis var. sinensis]
MVARKFLVRHNDSDFDIDYDTDDGFEIFGGDDDRLVSDDSDLLSISDRLRLLSVNDEEGKSVDQNAELVKSDEEFARMLQAEEEALMLQQYVATEDNSQIETRIRPYVSQVLMYEDPNRQDSARKTVPVERLEEKALVALAKSRTNGEGEGEAVEGWGRVEMGMRMHDGREGWRKVRLGLGVIRIGGKWVVQSGGGSRVGFPMWVNAPSCDGCGGETTGNGMGIALSSETLYGASRVELYRCNSCSTITRFPRYNDPLKLLETRRGRCGEWANCFTLYCRAFGYESRLVMDFTDHVWTECMSPVLGRWMHLDPCEGIYDNPLLYEKGWKKNLNYVIAFAKDGVYDVTKRYTRKWHEVLSRRNITTDPILSIILSNIRRECRQNFTSQVISALEEQDRNEAEALERELHSKDDASISLPGRQSGDKEWRMSRSEFGSDEICFPSSCCCPARKCIDEHVTKIYNAFCPIISQFVEKSCSKSRAVEVLLFFKQMLINLKNSPFRTRRTSINPVSNGAQHLFLQMLPSFGQLFDALSLKSELDASGRVDIYLAADPVRTSIALPVLFHALDDVIHNVNICNNFNKNSLSWPLQKLNRIYSGLVLASGEELPFGIVTSAFDGTRMSKWEEPNGARGCWIVYKVLDNQMHELVAYELMSANDAPERDPMDWYDVLEYGNGFYDKQTKEILYRDKGSNVHGLYQFPLFSTASSLHALLSTHSSSPVPVARLAAHLELIIDQMQVYLGSHVAAAAFLSCHVLYLFVFVFLPKSQPHSVNNPFPLKFVHQTSSLCFKSRTSSNFSSSPFLTLHQFLDHDSSPETFLVIQKSVVTTLFLCSGGGCFSLAWGRGAIVMGLRSECVGNLNDSEFEEQRREVVFRGGGETEKVGREVLEGSDDGGSSWRALDKQSSQMFKNRFERKTFKIRSVGFLANAFRFRFLAVRDRQATSRFQLGSIDLYASG